MDLVPGVYQPAPDDESDDVMSAPLSAEEISVVVSQLKNGRVPGLDEVSAEVLKLGSVESAKWLKVSR